MRETTDKKEVSKLNMDFHLRMYSVLPQKMLYDMIKDLWRKYSVTKKVFSLVQGRAEISVEQHEEILKTMEEKNYDETERLMREHKIQAGKAFCRQMEQRGQG